MGIATPSRARRRTAYGHAADALAPETATAWATPADAAEALSAGAWYRAPHLAILADAFAWAVATPGARLMVTMPPQHGKTELVSHWGPLWALERDPATRVILGSYGAQYATRHGRWVRNAIVRYADTLRVRLAPDLQAAHEWETTAGGGMVTVGAEGGTITGLGGDLIIIDDPVKDRADAESPAVRRHHWEWYTDTLSTRLRPGACIVFVMTRWHKDDLAGRLLREAQAGGDQWRQVHMPAIAEEPASVEPCGECSGDGARYRAGAIQRCPVCGGSGQVAVEAQPDPIGRAPGEALWPERYPLAYLEETRRRIGTYGFASLYQGRPTPRGGGAFWTDDDLRLARERAPRGMAGDLGADLVRVVVAVDPADSAEAGADETGIVVAGRERHGPAGVLADLSGAMTPDQWGRRAVQAAIDHQADAIVYEANKGGKNTLASVIRTAAAAMGERPPKLVAVNAKRGKALRAEPVHQLYREGLVWHAGVWPDLDEQLTTWKPDDDDSPDRLDALVHAITELLLARKGGLTVT